MEKQSKSSGSNTNQNFYSKSNENSSTISHNGKILGVAHKKVQNASFLISQNGSSLMNKIKLKCVSKINQNQVQSDQFQQILIIYSNKYDIQHFQQYVKGLKKSLIKQGRTHFIKSVQEYLKLQKQKHQKQLVLMSQYSAINNRKYFKQAEQIIIIADEEYESCSYLMKQPNIKHILYQFKSIDKILSQKKFIQKKSKVCEQRNIQPQKEIKNVSNCKQYEINVIKPIKQIKENEFNKQNKQSITPRNSSFLPMNSINPQKRKERFKMLPKTNIQKPIPFAQYQINKNNEEITFQKLESGLKDKDIKINNNNTNNYHENHLYQDHIIVIEDSNFNGLNQYDRQLRKVTFQKLKEKQKENNSNQNQIRKRKSNKISMPWYKKYVKSLTSGSQSKNSECQSQSQSQNVGVQCQILKNNNSGLKY